MSETISTTVKSTNLKHASASGNNVVLDSSGNTSLSGNLAVTGTTTLTGAVELPDDTVDIADLSATGTASSSTYLRGDNTWSAPASGLTQLAETSTSGADNYTWESIPSGFKRLTLILQTVSMSGTDAIKIELGGSSYYTSGYQGTSGFIAGTSGNAQEFASTDAFYAYQAVAAKGLTGHAIITPTDTGTSSSYVYSFTGTHQDGSAGFGAGHLTGVTDAITKVKIRSSGSNTFDGGTVGVLYEV